jgi:hypothetical protein
MPQASPSSMQMHDLRELLEEIDVSEAGINQFCRNQVVHDEDDREAIRDLLLAIASHPTAGEIAWDLGEAQGA